MNVLFLEAYCGGSHRAFLEGWRRRSRHHVRALTLPARKWKWRMQGAAWVFAERLARENVPAPDVVFATDMLNLAEFRGLAPASVARRPTLLYFHENQYSYPNQTGGPPEYVYGAMNAASALAADALIFNSEFHRRDFFDCWRRGNRVMPDEALDERRIDALEAAARVVPVGVDFAALDSAAPNEDRRPGAPPLVVWNHRWEHDKNPEEAFTALRRVKGRGGRFRLAVCGEAFADAPPCFEEARRDFVEEIEVFGRLDRREDYAALLWRADVALSTAVQEFLGLSVIEAIWCGARPLLPRRVNYPRLLPEAMHGESLYEDEADFARKLEGFLCRPAPPTPRPAYLAPYAWPAVAARLDDLVEIVARDEGHEYRGGTA